MVNMASAWVSCCKRTFVHIDHVLEAVVDCDLLPCNGEYSVAAWRGNGG